MESSLRHSSPHLLLCDADDITVKLLAADLRRQERFHVAACTARISEIRHAVNAQRPSVLLLGLSSRDSFPQSLAVLRQVRSEFSWIRAVVMSEETDHNEIVEIFRAGARGFFDRSGYDPAQLCRCIQCVADGQVWVRSELLIQVLNAFAGELPVRPARGAEYLTPRECDVARLVSDGLSNSDVAKELGISINTVKNYLFSVFDKTGVSNRAELMLYLLSNKVPSRNAAVAARFSSGTKRGPRTRKVARGLSVVPKRPT